MFTYKERNVPFTINHTFCLDFLEPYAFLFHDTVGVSFQNGKLIISTAKIISSPKAKTLVKQNKFKQDLNINSGPQMEH